MTQATRDADACTPASLVERTLVLAAVGSQVSAYMSNAVLTRTPDGIPPRTSFSDYALGASHTVPVLAAPVMRWCSLSVGRALHIRQAPRFRSVGRGREGRRTHMPAGLRLARHVRAFQAAIGEMSASVPPSRGADFRRHATSSPGPSWVNGGPRRSGGVPEESPSSAA